MKNIENKNNDQIESLKKFNLVRFKKKWIDSKI